MLPRFDYVRAKSTNDATRRLAETGARLYAGGTDLLGCLHDGVLDARTVVSLSGLDELRGIRSTPDGGLEIGAMTTVAQVAGDSRIRERWPGLARAASDVASPQLRNQGTLGGNLCQRPRCWYFRGQFHCAKKGGDFCYALDGENRYHAILGGGPCFIVHPSDTAPMLVALEAVVRIVGPRGDRLVRLEEFFVLPETTLERENVLAAGEIVTAILLPAPPAGLFTSYRKVRERGSWDFALASVALALRLAEGRVAEARVVFGGVAPVPWRSKETEAAITGRRIDAAVAAAAAKAAVADAVPLAQNGYKVPLLQGAIEESLLAPGVAAGR
jgi:xanthine dehydrogenase YagS FAD-binding subunit